MLEHTFRWQGQNIRLICFIESGQFGTQLILDDVCANSLATVNAVPDWKIESEATALAMDHGAKYL